MTEDEVPNPEVGTEPVTEPVIEEQPAETEPEVAPEPPLSPDDTPGNPVRPGDINADLLEFVGARIVAKDAIAIPYTRDDVAAAIAFLCSTGKLNSDGSRVWA